MNEYNTNIIKLTCSCPDWKETRQEYKLNDPRRLCKHIINKLDVNNLPIEISKFKESIEFYQKKEWGFKRNFGGIIELDTFTLLGDIDWIDVFDENGIRYGVLIELFSKDIYWAKDKKPQNFSIVENYLIKKSEKVPLPLKEEEYPQIISFIKEVLPHKNNHSIKIELEYMYIPTSKGIIYNIYESKYEQNIENILRREFFLKFDKEEAEKKLFNYLNIEDRFDVFEALIVTNNEIIIKMDNGKIYKMSRYYHELKKTNETMNLKNINNLIQNSIINKNTFIEEYNNIINQYDTLTNLLKEFSLSISIIKFNKVLQKLNYITKSTVLNRNNWIIIGDGLKYGINSLKMSKYKHDYIPSWYKVHVFDSKKMNFIVFNSITDIKMTSALFKKINLKNFINLLNKKLKIIN